MRIVPIPCSAMNEISYHDYLGRIDLKLRLVLQPICKEVWMLQIERRDGEQGAAAIRRSPSAERASLR